MSYDNFLTESGLFEMFIKKNIIRLNTKLKLMIKFGVKFLNQIMFH